MKKSLLLLVAIVFGINVQGQQGEHSHCGTDEYVQEVINEHPEMAQIFETRSNHLYQLAEEASANPTKKASGTVYTIPVVFHVIYDSPQDNIDRSQIMDALRMLNEDYRLQNADAANLRAIFQSRQADSEIEFALAKKDENGNCTDGITRIQSSLSVDASPRDRVKTLVQWDPDKYLNIWVVRSITSPSTSGTILGYANFPWMSASTDGIVIRHDALGLIGTAANANYDGRTLTHEVGHYLGLYHTFQGGCNGSGDGIADTPPVADASYGCNLNRNSCTSDAFPDMIENHMDYSDCPNTFTNGQKAVMRSTLQSAAYRQNLVSATNLDNTGVTNSPTCKPTALFDVVNYVICPGDTVSFIDETEEGEPDTYLWSLPGATPNTSSAANPSVVYNTPGSYQVSLTVSNAAGSSTITKTHLVHVKSLYNKYNAQWIENFEDASLPFPEVSVLTDDNLGFELTSRAASNGNQSLYLNNYSISYSGETDELISPNINTMFASGTELTFDYAFASKTGSSTDRLYIYASTDCGKTWSPRRILSGTLLQTASATSGDFIPSASEWKTATVSLAQYTLPDPIQIKFSFSSDGGNNLYIDNINLSANNISTEEVSLENALSVYPNPSSGEINIDLGAIKSDVSLNIYDLYGKEVLSYTLTDSHTTFDNLNLSSGVYILNFTNGKEQYSKKLIVE